METCLKGIVSLCCVPKWNTNIGASIGFWYWRTGFGLFPFHCSSCNFTKAGLLKSSQYWTPRHLPGMKEKLMTQFLMHISCIFVFPCDEQLFLCCCFFFLPVVLNGFIQWKKNNGFPWPTCNCNLMLTHRILLDKDLRKLRKLWGFSHYSHKTNKK